MALADLRVVGGGESHRRDNGKTARRTIMQNETVSVKDESQISDQSLEAVSGGIIEEILIAAAGAALYDGAKAAWDAYYEWVTRADRPPYTRAEQ
jgi:hypothetical protein